MTRPNTVPQGEGEMVDGSVSRQDVLNAHAEHGRLDWHMVKKAMGKNWPRDYEALGQGEGIFLPEEGRRP